MSAFAAGSGVIRNLILSKPRCGEAIHRHFKVIGIPLGLGRHFSPLKSQEKLGVLFVSQAIGGDVIRREIDRLLDGIRPLLTRLTGNSKYQIQVHIRHPRLAKDVIAPLGLGCGMHTPESFEQSIVPGLNTHADTIDAHREEGGCFFV